MIDKILATDLRKNFSETLDIVTRKNKPIVAQRTRDLIFLMKDELVDNLLSAYSFNTLEFKESDGSITLSSVEMDIVANGANKEISIENYIKNMKEYAEEYYNDIENWYIGNRKKHYPYVLELLIKSDEEIKDRIKICQAGEN